MAQNTLNFGSKVVFMNGLPLTLPVAAADPGSAAAGDMYYNSVSNLPRFYTGSVWETIGVGTVSSVSVTTANGLAGTVATATTTPAITLSTTITGILQGDGTAISAATIGDLTDITPDGITITGGTGAILGSGVSIAQHEADTSHSGYLSSTDWNTFNNKQDGLIFTDSLVNTTGTVTLVNDTASPSANQYYGTDGGSVLGYYTLPSPGTGTVSSVTFTGDGTVLSNTPSSAVTTTGTLTATINTQTANTALLGPTSGAAASPTFRALASSDANGTTLSTASNLYNLSISTAVASNNLTISVKQKDGSTDPTSDNPAVYSLRNATATTGSYAHQALTSASSVVLLAHTPMGLTLSQNQFLYVYGATSGVILAAPAIWDEQTLQAYVPESANVTSISNASPGVITLNGHGLNNGDSVTLTTSGGLPTGLSVDTPYFVVAKATNTFELAATAGGTAINTSSAGSGTHTYHIASNRLVCSAGTSPSTSAAIRLLGRVQVNNSSAVAWTAPAEASPPSAPQGPRAPTLQKFVSAASGTYQTPINVLYIRVRMVGAGGGGAAGNATGTATAGTATAFGTSLLSAGGGGGATGAAGVGGSGGTSSLGTGPVGIVLIGGIGGTGLNNDNITNAYNTGGNGGVSAFGGAGGGGQSGAAGSAAAASTGSGGGGGGTSQVTNGTGGGGGGAGGFIDAIITNPAALYAYTVGTHGNGGTGSGAGFNGANGADGAIYIEEYYQ